MFDTGNSLGKKILHIFCSVCKCFLLFSYYLTQPPKSNILPASYALFLMWKLIWLVWESLHFSLSFTRPPGFMCHSCHVCHVPWSICSHSSHSLLCAIPASQEYLHQFSECFSQLASAKEWRDSPTALSLLVGLSSHLDPPAGLADDCKKGLTDLLEGEGEEEGEGEVFGGVDGLMLIVRMTSSEVTGELLFTNLTWLMMTIKPVTWLGISMLKNPLSTVYPAVLIFCKKFFSKYLPVGL